MLRKVKHYEDKQTLQNDLDKLVKWSDNWQMLFNYWKSKYLRTKQGYLDIDYKMENNVL